MNYQQSLDYIKAKEQFGSRLGLSRIRALCAALGDPQDTLPIIHIAGTNGKGSTSLYIANILADAGLRVGRYISPAVHGFAERITINGAPIPEDSLSELVTHIAKFDINSLEFEFVTALAFLHFAREKCDYVVLEVGLGGQHDATNIIKSPALSVLTLIDIDHTEHLGKSIREIAQTKCGIIKHDCPVVSYPFQHPDAQDVIENTCHATNSALTFAPSPQIISSALSGTKFTIPPQKTVYELSLPGLHQAANASLAITAVNNLPNFTPTELSIQNGLKSSKFTARFEMFHTKTSLIILDGAHNASGAKALADSLIHYFPDKPITLVMGILADKEYEKCTEFLAPLASRFIATTSESPRALDPAILAQVAAQHCSNVQVVPDRFEALRAALPDEVICVCGSLYLMKDLPSFISTLN